MRINCSNVNQYGNKCFILSTESLFSYDKGSEDITLYGLIRTDQQDVVIASAIVDKKLYMIPYNGNTMRIFDIETEDFEEIPFGFESEGYKSGTYAIGCAYHNEIFWVCAGVNIPLFSYNVLTGEYRDRSAWKKEFLDNKGRIPELCVWHNPCMVRNEMWLPIDEQDTVLQYNMDTDEYKLWKVGNHGIIFNTINYDGKFFWMTGNKGVIIKWNPRTEEVQEYDEFPQLFKEKEKEEWTGIFWEGIYEDGYIYYAPLNSNMFVAVDTSSGKIEEMLKINEEYACLMFSKINNEEIYIEIKNTKSEVVEESYIMNINNKKFRRFQFEFDYGMKKSKLGKNAEKNLNLQDTVVTDLDSLKLLIHLIQK